MLAETNPKTNPRSPLELNLWKKRTRNEPKINPAILLKIKKSKKTDRRQNGENLGVPGRPQAFHSASFPAAAGSAPFGENSPRCEALALSQIEFMGLKWPPKRNSSRRKPARRLRAHAPACVICFAFTACSLCAFIMI